MFSCIGILVTVFVWWAQESRIAIDVRIQQSHYVVALLVNNIPMFLMLLEIFLNRIMPNIFLTISAMVTFTIIAFISIGMANHDPHTKLTPMEKELLVFNTFSVIPVNKPTELQLYTVPIMVSLLDLVGNQVKFCLLNEGDGEEASGPFFD